MIAQSSLEEIGESFGFFEYAIVGGPILLAGIIFYATIGYKLLPDNPIRKDDDSVFDEQKDFSNVPKWKKIMSLVVLVGTPLGMIFEDQIGISLSVTGCIGALGEHPSPILLTFIVFIICCVLTNFMSNTATTALMAPICLSIAQGMGVDPRAVLMACVIGGSCAYATPIGMPANTMVLGAGDYKFMDYVKAGLPLIVIATVVSMIILPIAFPFFS